MKRTNGFTVIELMVVIVLLGIGGWLFFTEKGRVDSAQRDTDRKMAINAMYYNLEEVYYEKNQYYPTSIDSKTLRAMDPELFTDPDGFKLGQAGSSYHYDGKGCATDGKCTGYTLRADLEREDDYIKNNRTNK